MAKDYRTHDRTDIRRADRAVTDDAWIRTFLHAAPMGYLATVHEQQPFINGNLFVYDETANTIFMHTARKGRTRANVEVAERVCFTISEMGRLLPSDVALEFSVEYSSVVVFGCASVIDDADMAAYALQLLLDKYFPHLQAGRDYRPPVPEELVRTSVYAIKIEEWTGKRKSVEADFPGAYLYGETDG